MKNYIIVAVSVLVILLIGIGIGYNMSTPHFAKYSRFGSQEAFQGVHMMNGKGMSQNMFYDTDETGGLTMADMMGNMNLSLKGQTGDQFDQVFLVQMIMHHQGAVQMAELALKQAKHQEIKDLAQAIIAAQNKEIADMKTWLQDWYNK